jgi:hypothetical protein
LIARQGVVQLGCFDSLAQTTRLEKRGAARADAVVQQVLADQGTPGQEAQVTVTCDAPGDNCHVGTAVITVRVESAVDLPFFPAIFDKGAASFALDAIHTVPIGQYVESATEDGDEDGER